MASRSKRSDLRTAFSDSFGPHVWDYSLNVPLDYSGKYSVGVRSSECGFDQAQALRSRTRAYKRLPKIQREESFCSTCSEAGESPTEDPAEFEPGRSILFKENSWSSIQVEDGSDEEIEDSVAFGDTFVDDPELSDYTGSDNNNMGTIHIPKRDKNSCLASEIVTSPETTHGRLIDAILLYAVVCVVIVFLRSAPLFFSLFFG